MPVRWIRENGGKLDGLAGFQFDVNSVGLRFSKIVEEEVAGFDEGVEGGVGVGGGYGGEGLAVERAGAVLAEGLAVFGRGVAFVRGEAVLGVERGRARA